jgi:hypothetical protein
MSRLLKIKVEPVLSMNQKQAADAVGGLKVLRDLEEKWGLTPWDENPTNRRYAITSIEAAMARAEQAVFLGRRERNELKPKPCES